MSEQEWQEQFLVALRTILSKTGMTKSQANHLVRIRNYTSITIDNVLGCVSDFGVVRAIGSALVLFSQGSIHIQVGYGLQREAIVTFFLPDGSSWEEAYRKLRLDDYL